MVKQDKRDEFISDNLLLVHSICRKFVGRGVEYDDLFQCGCIGLIKAADNFDESRGLKFSTYAVPVIMGEVRRIFRDGGSVKVSRSVKELGLKIARERDKIESKLGREATVGEIAEYLGVSKEEVTEAICASQPTVSLTTEDFDDKSSEMQLPSGDSNRALDDRIVLDCAFNALDDLERKVIVFRYYNSLTQSETAKKLSISQVQVSRIEKKVLLKLRQTLSAS